MRFHIEQYRGKYVMHCKTEEEAQIFLEFLSSIGRTWCDGKSYLENLNYNYEGQTAYAFNEGRYGRTDRQPELGFKVINFDDFDWDDDITPPRAATFSVSIISFLSLQLFSYKRSNTRAL